MIIGAIWKDIYRIGANFLLLHTNFQQNKDCNRTAVGTRGSVEGCIRTSSKTRTATRFAVGNLLKQVSCIRTSSKTRTATPTEVLPFSLLSCCIRTSSKTRTATSSDTRCAIVVIQLHTNFQQNKDCNCSGLSGIPSLYMSCIRTSSKTRTATRFRGKEEYTLLGVAYELPAKQGLQHCNWLSSNWIVPRLHTNFQQNKDCNPIWRRYRLYRLHVAYELPAKQGLQQGIRPDHENPV